MTTRTVEVERTVTDEEEVYICDFCGESADDSDEEMLSYWKIDHNSFGIEKNRSYPELHLHTGCAERGLGDLGPRPKDDENDDRSISNLWQYETSIGQIVLSPWYAFSWPARKIAWWEAERWGQDEPWGDDWMVGWMCTLAMYAVVVVVAYLVFL